MEKIYFYLPTKVFFEKGGIEKYLPQIKNYGNKFLIVSGRNFIFRSGLFERIKNILEKERIEFSHFSNVKPEPDTENVEEGVEFCKKEGCDCIVAIGGGSAIDVGKAIALRSKNSGRIENYFGEKEYENEPLPVIAIPTTCGTGSEVTRYSVLVYRKENTKKTIISDRIIPKVAILDSSVLDTLPESLVAATGMDAFSHSAESFLSVKKDKLSEIFSIESLKILWEFLPSAVKGDDESKEKVFFSSLLAGFAINKTGTIIVHGIGYSLTVKYGIHHGTANALLLPYVFKYLYKNGYREEIERLGNIFGKVENIKNFVKKLGLPVRLKDIGVKEDDIDELVKLSKTGCERALKNMKIKEIDFREILISAF
ncbi:MAG: hypothetical protein DRP67_00760 [Candidatus Omnitrophota bacterium]|nr:MAG: hypothetical protein DRP67_00760 [Candidatus Omnitrophota bacterium]